MVAFQLSNCFPLFRSYHPPARLFMVVVNSLHFCSEFLEDNGFKLLDISLGNYFFVFDTKSKGNKSKNKQVGLHQTKKLLYGKETTK